MIKAGHTDASIWVPLISFLCFLFVWFLERLIGLGWYYHLDSLHYVADFSLVLNGNSPISLPQWVGKGYYLFVSTLNGSPFLIITANGFLFSLTNLMLWRLHSSSLNKSDQYFSIFIFLILLSPYRVHLATTPLKETLFTIFVVLMYCPSYRVKFLGLLLSSFIRKAGIVYSCSLLPSRYVLPIFLMLLIAVFFLEPLKELSVASFTVDLKTRSWDLVPTFQDFGHLGNLIRFLTWPILLTTGTYFLISPSALFGIMAICQILMICYLVRFEKPLLPLNLYLGLGILAVVAPGFSSYLRYAYPLILITYVISKPAVDYKYFAKLTMKNIIWLRNIGLSKK